MVKFILEKIKIFRAPAKEQIIPQAPAKEQIIPQAKPQ
jgi:hypothetical protein